MVGKGKGGRAHHLPPNQSLFRASSPSPSLPSSTLPKPFSFFVSKWPRRSPRPTRSSTNPFATTVVSPSTEKMRRRRERVEADLLPFFASFLPFQSESSRMRKVSFLSPSVYASGSPRALSLSASSVLARWMELERGRMYSFARSQGADLSFPSPFSQF